MERVAKGIFVSRDWLINIRTPVKCETLDLGAVHEMWFVTILFTIRES